MPIFTALAGLGAGVLGGLGVAAPATFASSLVAGAATAAAVGGGIASGIGALTGQEETSTQAPQVTAAPVIPSIAPAPTPEKAINTAQEEINKQKRMRLLAGGQTILSSEGPNLTGGGKTLLGS